MKKQAGKTQFKGVVLLLLTALIWGSSFVAQSVGMRKIEAFTYSGIRTLMGAVVLLPFIIISEIRQRRSLDAEQLSRKKARDKKTVLCGCILGIVFCFATNFQQFAFNYSTSGKIAFITALYMFFVPIIGLVFRKRTPLLTWICVLIGFVGLYFLCIDPRNLAGVNRGDMLTAVCAVFFAIHILLVERFSPDTDGLKLSCTQFVVAGIISCILMFIFEEPRIPAIKSAIIPLLYSGVMSCGIAYTLQIIGQKYTEATIASLIMCGESVFGVLTGAVLLHETLTPREILGCAVMFAAIILSQLSDVITARIKDRRPSGRS
ncbi:MAG: DMT family transporter [Oscillospiraceae bacterium]|nr:DMT family transporter [Oscillospiraceae bacterium]